MTAAENILKQKRWIKKEIDKRLPQNSDAIWEEARQRLDGILAEYADIPKGERTHTDNYIFPSAAIYLSLKEFAGPEMAYDIIETAASEYSSKMGAKLAVLMRVPGMRSLFIRVWEPLTNKMFGQGCGFQNRFYPKEKGAYRMDVTACPYHKYLSLLGCPEINSIFCDNDERVYGNLPGIEFRRSTTIGRGGDRCDFYVRKIK